MRKRTVTTIEMHQIVIVRRPAGAALAWCPACLKEVEMVSLEEAAFLSGVSLRDVCRRVSDGDIHLVETANGSLVCLSSLPNMLSLRDGEVSPGGADTLSQTAAGLSDTADQ